MKHTILICILSLFLITPVLGDINPITSHEEIKDFANNTSAGNANYFEMNFTTNHVTTVSITFAVTNDSLTNEVWMNDWEVTYTLDGIIITPTEVSNSTFTTNSTLIVGSHNLVITYTPVANLVPGNYTLSLDLSAEGYTIKKSSSGGSRGYYPTPTPTPTPVNATETPTPVPVNETNITEKHINVTEPTQEPDGSNLYLYGILGVIASALLIYLYGKHKK